MGRGIGPETGSSSVKHRGRLRRAARRFRASVALPKQSIKKTFQNRKLRRGSGAPQASATEEFASATGNLPDSPPAADEPILESPVSTDLGKNIDRGYYIEDMKEYYPKSWQKLIVLAEEVYNPKDYSGWMWNELSSDEKEDFAAGVDRSDDHKIGPLERHFPPSGRITRVLSKIREGAKKTALATLMTSIIVGSVAIPAAAFVVGGLVVGVSAAIPSFLAWFTIWGVSKWPNANE